MQVTDFQQAWAWRVVAKMCLHKKSGFRSSKSLLLMVQKSGDHQLRLVVYPIMYRVLYIQTVGFLNHHQVAPNRVWFSRFSLGLLSYIHCSLKKKGPFQPAFLAAIVKTQKANLWKSIGSEKTLLATFPPIQRPGSQRNKPFYTLSCRLKKRTIRLSKVMNIHFLRGEFGSRPFCSIPLRKKKDEPDFFWTFVWSIADDHVFPAPKTKKGWFRLESESRIHKGSGWNYGSLTRKKSESLSIAGLQQGCLVMNCQFSFHPVNSRDVSRGGKCLRLNKNQWKLPKILTTWLTVWSKTFGFLLKMGLALNPIFCVGEGLFPRCAKINP